ncbi:hypothetical protein [Vibrio sp. D173a]|nr:hypothetical protein [Vibrio sp. D173a]
MDMTILSLVGALGAGQRIVIGLDGNVLQNQAYQLSVSKMTLK